MAVQGVDVRARDVEGKNHHRGRCRGGCETADLLQIRDQVAAAVGGGNSSFAKISHFAEAFDHGQGEKQEDGETGKPWGDQGRGRGASGQHAQGVEAGEDQNVHQRDSLQVKGVGRGGYGIEQQPERKGGREQRQQRAGAQDQHQCNREP